MAATSPKQEPQRGGDPYDRPTIASTSRGTARRSWWIAIVIGVVVLAVIGVIVYMALYGDGGSSGGGSGGGSGDGGGLYGFALAFSADQARRLRGRIRNWVKR
jgi:hypothetical protein